MSGAEFVFYLLSGVAVIMAAGVILARNPVHSALFLVISFLNVAGIYAMLGAEFLAAVQVLVYTGAILVVFVFVIMLVRPEDLGELRSGSPIQTTIAWILGLALFGEVAAVISTGILVGQRGAQTPAEIAAAGGNTQALGRILYSQYLLPFEVASLVLLVAVIAAIVLGVPERAMNMAATRTKGTISLGHPTGTDTPPAIGAPDLGRPGTVDVDREPEAVGSGKTAP
jgi:NADH-quinone oxidoreductase subunit J